MRGHRLRPDEIIERGLRGWILAEDVQRVDGRKILRKGQIIDDHALAALGSAAPGALDVVEPSPDDVHEDVVGWRVAQALAGEGLRISGPAQSRYNMVADRRGLLRIDAERIVGVNRISGVAVFTLLDRLAVLPGKVVAGVKAIPLVVPEDFVREAERLASAGSGPAIQVRPFLPHRVTVIATDSLTWKLRDRFEESIRRKIAWYGSSLTGIQLLASDTNAVIEAIASALPDHDIVLLGGGNTVDPLDPALMAIEQMGARMIHFGAPAHPGSMFWLARLGDVWLFNLASCSLYSSSTFADLVLPLVMAGEALTADDIDQFGYGGLLEHELAFRFPPYGEQRSDEAGDG